MMLLTLALKVIMPTPRSERSSGIRSPSSFSVTA
jgi:hypothetical protein